MRIADRHFRLRQPLGMRAEHHRAALGGAVGVGHCGARQRAVQRLHQAVAHRRRAHAHELDAGYVGAREQVGLAQHHGDHRRHRGEPGAAIAPDRLDVGARGELRQQHDGGVRRAREQRQRQRVHVIERRGDEIAVAVEPGREARLNHPDVARVREHDALRRAGRAGGVEEHRRLVRRGDDRVERAGIEEGVECGAERHAGNVRRTIRRARTVAEHELGTGIADDEVDRLPRELEVHRHRDEAGAHDAVIRRKIFGAVGGQDGDAVAALEPACGERARDAVRHGVELRVGEFTRALLAAEIDDRDLRQIAITLDEFAEIPEIRHYGLRDPR